MTERSATSTNPTDPAHGEHANRPADEALPAAVESAVADSLAYLESATAAESYAADPYWPKWHSPWWHLQLLTEMGLAHRIPPAVLDRFLTACRAHYLETFPFRVEDVPPDRDPQRQVFCHCALGSLVKLVAAAGRDVEQELPFARVWFLRYQLPDGGLNCDEAAYTRERPHSSMLSTLPALEAMLAITAGRDLREEEAAFLDRGADYLLTRRLLWRASDPECLIEGSWMNMCFPRFYDYDVLRGMAFLCQWADRRGRQLSARHLDEPICLITSSLDPATGDPETEREIWRFWRTTLRRRDDGTWAGGSPSDSFPLLVAVGTAGQPCIFLRREVALVYRHFPTHRGWRRSPRFPVSPVTGSGFLTEPAPVGGVH